MRLVYSSSGMSILRLTPVITPFSENTSPVPRRVDFIINHKLLPGRDPCNSPRRIMDSPISVETCIVFKFWILTTLGIAKLFRNVYWTCLIKFLQVSLQGSFLPSLPFG